MSRELADLDGRFLDKIGPIIDAVNNDSGSYQLRVFYTLRTPEEQARLWRQSRAIEQITQAIFTMRRHGAQYLASVLDGVGPQYGRWATNSLPGNSWHQWGLAVDAFVQSGGRAVWDSEHPGYKAYSSMSKDAGLNAGGLWRRKDAVHVQFHEERVSQMYTWSQVDEEMKRRFII